MPHFVLEYSDNIREKAGHEALFKQLHEILVTKGPVPLKAIKSRAIMHRDFRVGDGNKSNAFVHLTLSLMKGRDLALRKAMGEALFACVKDAFAQSSKELNCSFSLEIREMERETYFMFEGGK